MIIHPRKRVNGFEGIESLVHLPVTIAGVAENARPLLWADTVEKVDCFERTNFSRVTGALD
jgi:hypothetical protein